MSSVGGAVNIKEKKIPKRNTYFYIVVNDLRARAFSFDHSRQTLNKTWQVGLFLNTDGLKVSSGDLLVSSL